MPYRPLFKEKEPVKFKYEFTNAELEEALLDYLEHKSMDTGFSEYSLSFYRENCPPYRTTVSLVGVKKL